MSKSKTKKDKYKVSETKEIKNDWWNKGKKEDKKEVKRKVKFPPLPNGLSSNRPH